MSSFDLYFYQIKCSSTKALLTDDSELPDEFIAICDFIYGFSYDLLFLL